MKISNTMALFSMVSFLMVASCNGGGGPDDPAACESGTVYDGISQMCVTVTDTDTSTDTSTATDTNTATVTTTDTSTNTNTVTTVTIPDWFVVGEQNIVNMQNDAGQVYATVRITTTKVNGDGTYVAKVDSCSGNCDGIGGSWTGVVSTQSISIKEINATGVIPAAVADPYARSSGVWSYNQSNGTYTL